MKSNLRINPLAISLYAWVFFMLNLRPSAIGQSHNVVVWVFFMLSSILVVHFQEGGIRYKFEQKELILFGTLFVTFCYFLVQGLLLSSARKNVINSCVVLFTSLPFFLQILGKRENRSIVAAALINIHVLLSISQIVTFGIFCLSGFKLHTFMIVANVQAVLKYYMGIDPDLIHYIAFPFTLVWSTFDAFGIHFYRTCGLYREPGMAQIFYLTTFFISFFYRGNSMFLKRTILLAGSLLLFSASGFINILIGWAAYVVFNEMRTRHVKINFFFQMAIGLFAAIVFTIGIFTVVKEKFERESGNDRFQNIKTSINKLSQNPLFGKGYYGGFKMDSTGKVISEEFYSFLGIMDQLGLVGIALYILCWAVALRHHTSWRSLCIYIPCLATLLSSQPSYNDVFTWFLLMFNTSALRNDS